MLKLFEIEHEDFIVAKSERDMRSVYFNYVGEPIGRLRWREIPPDELVELSSEYDDREVMPAREFATSRGYFPARG